MYGTCITFIAPLRFCIHSYHNLLWFGFELRMFRASPSHCIIPRRFYSSRDLVHESMILLDPYGISRDIWIGFLARTFLWDKEWIRPQRWHRSPRGLGRLVRGLRAEAAFPGGTLGLNDTSLGNQSILSGTNSFDGTILGIPNARSRFSDIL